MTEPLTAAQIIKMIHPDLPPATAHFLLNEAKPLLEWIEAQAEELAKYKQLATTAIDDAVALRAERGALQAQVAALQADAGRWRHAMDWSNTEFAVCMRDGMSWTPIKTNGPIDAAGINGLTEAETSASMSVRGLSAPIVGLQSVNDAITNDPSLCDQEPSTPLSKFVNSSPSEREAIGTAAVAVADAEMAKMTAPSTAVALIGCVQHDCADCKARAALLQSTPDARPVGEPVQFLCDATRFKVRQHEGDEAGRIYGLPSELNGRWVALVAADDDCHIAAARTQPERVPNHTEQANAAHAAASNHTNEIVKLVNAARNGITGWQN